MLKNRQGAGDVIGKENGESSRGHSCLRSDRAIPPSAGTVGFQVAGLTDFKKYARLRQI